MRRMRDFSIGHYVAVAVPVLGAAFGIHYLIKHHGATPGKETAVVTKPSQSKPDSKESKGSRKIASAMGEKDRDHASRESDREESAVAQDSHGSAEGARTPSAELHAAANDAAASGKGCAQIEYRGDGPEQTRVTKADWAAVMDQFHGAKNSLLGWLQQHRNEFPDGAANVMERQVKSLKIQRPPAADEPDLAWRGIGIYTQGNDTGEPLIKLGGGFVKLAVSHPARAKFEMTRLVAQAWAPCELGRAGGDPAIAAWNPLLKCLGVGESQSCAVGSYSEGGWAVSTTVAAAVSPPGCQIKAFESPELGKCLKHIPLHATSQVKAGEPARLVASASGSVEEAR